jgi:carboxymethylenebutenolidase
MTETGVPMAPATGGLQAGWIHLSVPSAPGVAPTELRCWWAQPARLPRGGVLVLPEVFGVNGWVRSVAVRLAEQGYAALAVPLFSRTAPDLELGYGEADLAEGRGHKERTTALQLLADVGVAARWLQTQLTDPGQEGEGAAGPTLGCVGFCFGGHVALLAATLPQIAATCDFYGAGVASGRPGGGPPTLEVLPEVSGRLLCFCGRRDPLIPPSDVGRIAAALGAADASGQRLRLIEADAGHGYLCEARDDYNPEAAAAGWSRMLELFESAL